MSSASRAPRIPVALYQAVGPAGKSGSKLRRASEISLTTPGWIWRRGCGSSSARCAAVSNGATR